MEKKYNWYFEEEEEEDFTETEDLEVELEEEDYFSGSINGYEMRVPKNGRTAQQLKNIGGKNGIKI